MPDRWSRKLARPLPLREGGELRTLDDARAFVLELPAGEQHARAWQRATELMLAAAQGGSMREATDQIWLALFTMGRAGFHKQKKSRPGP